MLISIHALREESDALNGLQILTRIGFQSTLSVRRATSTLYSLFNVWYNFNPRSPWGERHASIISCIRFTDFNPRSPWGERPTKSKSKVVIIDISIHALREESDTFSQLYKIYISYFNPRSPWGERLVDTVYNSVCSFNFNPRSPWGERLNTHISFALDGLFQSTLSVRRATCSSNKE